MLSLLLTGPKDDLGDILNFPHISVFRLTCRLPTSLHLLLAVVTGAGRGVGGVGGVGWVERWWHLVGGGQESC